MERRTLEHKTDTTAIQLWLTRTKELFTFCEIPWQVFWHSKWFWYLQTNQTHSLWFLPHFQWGKILQFHKDMTPGKGVGQTHDPRREWGQAFPPRPLQWPMSWEEKHPRGCVLDLLSYCIRNISRPINKTFNLITMTELGYLNILFLHIVLGEAWNRRSKVTPHKLSPDKQPLLDLNGWRQSRRSINILSAGWTKSFAWLKGEKGRNADFPINSGCTTVKHKSS